ncbi:transcriptional regulator NanR [Nitratireductor basaltis]|uniref:Putative GntR family transcriptional regulator n=1 Tax=Nitratireductor basaltis TaxID=472175 RepID=A0A084U8N2_9HYPH|nr:transcriptional regulator NanR [Nitratireductor basaltis]KFB09318.1 putative GntR family transcriptional regulator [Nitratireductor basaltis]
MAIQEATNSDRIVRRKLSDEVFDRLRAMILTGELRPGDTVPSERDLMARFGVGRPAVREALQTMHIMGLITVSHGERSRVNELTPTMAFQQVDAVAQLLLTAEPENLEHLKEARKLFEVGIIKAAAVKRTEADIEELRQLLKEQRSKLGNAPDFIRGDIAFHTKIASISGNPMITAVASAMLKWLFHYHTSLLHWSGREDVTLDEHERIIDALAKGDADLCAEIMTVHLDRSDAYYRHHRRA